MRVGSSQSPRVNVVNLIGVNLASRAAYLASVAVPRQYLSADGFPLVAISHALPSPTPGGDFFYG